MKSEFNQEKEIDIMVRDLTGKAKSCPMCGSKRIYMDEPKYQCLCDFIIKGETK